MVSAVLRGSSAAVAVLVLGADVACRLSVLVAVLVTVSGHFRELSHSVVVVAVAVVVPQACT